MAQPRALFRPDAPSMTAAAGLKQPYRPAAGMGGGRIGVLKLRRSTNDSFHKGACCVRGRGRSRTSTVPYRVPGAMVHACVAMKVVWVGRAQGCQRRHVATR